MHSYGCRRAESKAQLPWHPIPNSPKRLRCDACEAEFPVGRSCKCPSDSTAHSQRGDSPEPRGSSAVESQSVDYPFVERIAAIDRKADAIADELSSIATRIRQIQLDGASDDAEFELECLRDRRVTCDVEIKKLKEDRSRAISMQEYADKQEMPRLVKRYEQLAADLSKRGGSRRAARNDAN